MWSGKSRPLSLFKQKIKRMTIEEIIAALKELDVDGETTQYILEQIEMDEQMAVQLTTKYPSVVQEHLNELKAEGLI